MIASRHNHQQISCKPTQMSYLWVSKRAPKVHIRPLPGWRENVKRKIQLSVAALCAAVAGLTATPARATLVLSEAFDTYTNGTLAGQGGWTATTVAATPIQVAGASDKYAQINTSGQDDYKAFSQVIPKIDGNTLDTSMTINMSAAQATGDYFAHLSNPVGTTANFYQRLFAKSSGAGFVLGLLGSSGGSAGYSATVLNFNQEYDIDIAWTFVPGALNDTFAVTVDSVPYLNYTWDALSGAEPTQISAANLRQGTAANSATVQVDDYVINGVVPEPASLGLLAIGSVFAIRRRK
jgi:hypothetical protein